MLFNIKAFDVPLVIELPVCCRLCRHNIKGKNGAKVHAITQHCTYCNTMKRLIKELKEYQVITLILEGISNESVKTHTTNSARRRNELYAFSNSFLRESAQAV